MTPALRRHGLRKKIKHTRMPGIGKWSSIPEMFVTFISAGIENGVRRGKVVAGIGELQSQLTAVCPNCECEFVPQIFFERDAYALHAIAKHCGPDELRKAVRETFAAHRVACPKCHRRCPPSR